MQITTKRKQVIVAFVIVSIIIGLLSSYRLQTDVSVMREPKQGECRKTSSLENITCRLDPIVVRPESITLKMPPELEEVVPLWPNTRADKCIGNIKAKPMRKLSSNKYHNKGTPCQDKRNSLRLSARLVNMEEKRNFINMCGYCFWVFFFL